MKKVIRLDEPKEEKQPKPIELTHYLSGIDGWIKSNFVGDIEKMIYLGKDNTDGDIFSVHSNGHITICKGHLNDGVY